MLHAKKMVILLFIILVGLNASGENNSVKKEIITGYKEAASLYNIKNYSSAKTNYLLCINKINEYFKNVKNYNEQENNYLHELLFKSQLKLVEIDLREGLYENSKDITSKLDNLNKAWDYSWGQVLFISGAVNYLLGDVSKAKSCWDDGGRTSVQIYDEDSVKYQDLCGIFNFLYFSKDKFISEKPDIKLLDDVYSSSKEKNKLLENYLYVVYNIGYPWEKELKYGVDDDYIFMIAMKRKLKDINIIDAKRILTKLKETHKEKDIFYYLIDYEYNKIK